jgi:hypothetical protein
MQSFVQGEKAGLDGVATSGRDGVAKITNGIVVRMSATTRPMKRLPNTHNSQSLPAQAAAS